jgi:hypothetical protein
MAKLLTENGYFTCSGQRSVSQTITGTMTMTPTAAMEDLLGRPPLHVMNVAEAQAWIYKLMYDQQWRPKNPLTLVTAKSTGI